MNFAVLFLVALASHCVRGSPMYFPDEVEIDDNGRGAKLLPGVYYHPVPKSLENKPFPAMMSFGDNRKDDDPSLMMSIEAKLERMRNSVGMEPLELVLLSDYIHQSDNTTSEIIPRDDHLENKQNNETFPSLVNDHINKDSYNTQEIDSEISVNTQSNDTSNLSLVYDIDTEIFDNDDRNSNMERMESDSDVMDIEWVTEADYLTTEVVTEADYFTTEVSTINELEEPEPTSNVLAEDSVKNIIFGDDIFMFPTPKSPVKPILAEISRIVQKRPDINRCPIEGEIHYQGECYPLLSSWPCGDEKKWLVMKGFDFAECEPRPCPMGQLFYQDECVNPEDSNICAAGQMLYVEMSGISYCDCDPDYIYNPQDGTCIPEYEQGWCSWGQYLVNNKDGIPECTTNPCGISGSVFHKQNKRCYKKNYVGFCEQDFIEIKENEAECQEMEFIALRNVFEVPTFRRCPKGSLRDLLHECRRRFNMPSISSVLKARQLYGGCPHGWSKAAGRKCKKIVNLFSSIK